jgi:hypothetical protein
MTHSRITINGQHYDSPEAMPPDVRRLYEEAMRTLGPKLGSGPRGGTTQVFTGHAGHLGGSLIVNKTVTVNDRTYGSVDELPPDVRKMYEDALQGATPQGTRPTTRVHVSLNMAGPQIRTLDDAGRRPAPPPLPIEPSTLESRIRNIPVTLAIIILVALVLWARLGR